MRPSPPSAIVCLFRLLLPILHLVEQGSWEKFVPFHKHKFSVQGHSLLNTPASLLSCSFAVFRATCTAKNVTASVCIEGIVTTFALEQIPLFFSSRMQQQKLFFTSPK